MQTQTMCDVLLALELTARTARGALTDNANVIDQLSDKLVASETLRDQQAAQQQQLFTAATRKCDQLGAEVIALNNQHETVIRSFATRLGAVCDSDDPIARAEMLRALRTEIETMLPKPAEVVQAESIRERALATLDQSGNAN